MTAEQADERLVGELKSVVREAENVMKATAGQGGEGGNEARSRLAAALKSAKETCQRLEEKTVAAAKATDRVIREHPYESMGVAFGLGLLIGVLVASRK